jgi:hypothetical protein
MNRIVGTPPRRKAVTLIEAVLFISIAMAVIVGGLVFYQQASLAMKVMNVKRHVEAAIVETRAIQNQTGAWSYPRFDGWGVEITDLLDAYGALAPISNGFGNMEIEFYIDRFGSVDGTSPAGLPVDICGATVVEVRIKDVPVRACTRMAVANDSYQGFLSTGMLGVGTGMMAFPPVFDPVIFGQVAPITPQDAAEVCSYDGRLSLSDNTDFRAYFMILPPGQIPAAERRVYPGCNV